MKITALFHDDDGCRELLAEGIYHKADKGGWQDGKRSEPETEAWMEVTDITTTEGGSVFCDELESVARKALLREVTVDREDW